MLVQNWYGASPCNVSEHKLSDPERSENRHWARGAKAARPSDPAGATMGFPVPTRDEACPPPTRASPTRKTPWPTANYENTRQSDWPARQAATQKGGDSTTCVAASWAPARRLHTALRNERSADLPGWPTFGRIRALGPTSSVDVIWSNLGHNSPIPGRALPILGHFGAMLLEISPRYDLSSVGRIRPSSVQIWPKSTNVRFMSAEIGPVQAPPAPHHVVAGGTGRWKRRRIGGTAWR